MNKPFELRYNPHFAEWHAIRVESQCSVFRSKSKDDVVNWIACHGMAIQLDLF